MLCISGNELDMVSGIMFYRISTRAWLIHAEWCQCYTADGQHVTSTQTSMIKSFTWFALTFEDRPGSYRYEHIVSLVSIILTVGCQ